MPGRQPSRGIKKAVHISHQKLKNRSEYPELDQQSIEDKNLQQIFDGI